MLPAVRADESKAYDIYDTPRVLRSQYNNEFDGDERDSEGGKRVSSHCLVSYNEYKLI